MSASATADRTIHDGRRGLDARVRIHHPRGGTVPVAIVSHGFGGSRLGYAFLGKHLAAHGIAAIHVTHGAGEARIVARGQAGRADFLAALEDRERYRARCADVTAVLDALDAHALGDLPCALDAARVAFVGHSFGAHTGLLLAGARVLPGGLRFADPRLRAFALLSPPGVGERGLFPGSLDGIDRPVLLAYGTRDTGPRGQGPAWRAQCFDALPAGDKVEVVIDGAVHETFAGAPSDEGPPDPAHVQAVQSALLAFLRAHLLHDASALGTLRSTRSK